MPCVHSQYREAGTVTILHTACAQCAACASVCPAEVLAFEDGRIRVRHDSPFGCIACGHCMMVCPEGSIRVIGRGMHADDLVPLPPPSQRASADALAALMLARRSVRRFKREPVDTALLERIVDMAATAPMGVPPWDVGCVVVRGREKVRELAGEVVSGYRGLLRLMNPWILAAMRPLMRRATYDRMRTFIRPLGQMYIEGWRQGRDLVFYDAPAVLIFYHSPYADLADATIACTYAMLAAESLHLGTTMIGGAPPIIQRNKALSRRLGIPPGHTAAIALIVGHPAVAFKRGVRRRFLAVRMVD